ncbi:MAG: hypothetical protein MJ252_01330 [archaeon]|nr:hypothetical protein [archaeon]
MVYQKEADIPLKVLSEKNSKNLNFLKPKLFSVSVKEDLSNFSSKDKMKDLIDLFFELQKKEELNDYDYNKIKDIQTDISFKMRSILIDWIINVHSVAPKNQNTLFMAINIIDRYLSQRQILMSKFQLLGVAALFISDKYEEIFPFHIKDYVEFTAFAFERNDIIQMEHEILTLLDFQLNLPYANYFFSILTILFKIESKFELLGKFFLEAYLLNQNCLKYKQSEIALAVCFILLKMSNKWEEDSEMIKIIYGENQKNPLKLFMLSKDIYLMHEKKDIYAKEFPVVYRKYGLLKENETVKEEE